MEKDAGFSPKVNILTLAAYERARRALRGECEPNSRAGKMRTNISNEPSANIVKMREVGSRPCRLRQNKKRPSKTVFLVEAAGLDSRANYALGLPRSRTSTGSPLCTVSPSTHRRPYHAKTPRQKSGCFHMVRMTGVEPT